MANRFTEKAQNTLNNALRFARQLGHTYIGSEHILLSLAAERESVAAKMLLKNHKDEKSGSGSVEYFVSDNPENFSSVASIFLGEDFLGGVKKIEIQNY